VRGVSAEGAQASPAEHLGSGVQRPVRGAGLQQGPGADRVLHLHRCRASELLGVCRGLVAPEDRVIGVIRKGSRALQRLPASTDAVVWLRLYQRELRDLVPQGPEEGVLRLFIAPQRIQACRRPQHHPLHRVTSRYAEWLSGDPKPPKSSFPVETGQRPEATTDAVIVNEAVNGLRSCAQVKVLKPINCPQEVDDPREAQATDVTWRIHGDPADGAAVAYNGAEGRFHVLGTAVLTASYATVNDANSVSSSSPTGHGSSGTMANRNLPRSGGMTIRPGPLPTSGTPRSLTRSPFPSWKRPS
jgi:hypothetical protein